MKGTGIEAGTKQMEKEVASQVTWAGKEEMAAPAENAHDGGSIAVCFDPVSLLLS